MGKKAKLWETLRYVGLFWIVVLGLITIVGTGCSGGGGGGSGDSSASADTISGTVAAGAPVIGSITIKDSSSPEPETVNHDIEADGSYSFDVSGMTPPFLFRAEGEVGGRRMIMHSAGTEADVNGCINVTPLTDLIVSNVAGQLAENFYDNPDMEFLTDDALNEARDNLKQRLEPILTNLGLDVGIDLLRTSFSADHTELDAVLDIIRVTPSEDQDTVMKITNIITDDFIEDDVTDPDDSEVINLDPAEDLSSVSQAIASIEESLSAFSALFAEELPNRYDSELLALVSENLLDYGQNRDEFLDELTDTSSQELVGFTLGNVCLKEIDLDADPAVAVITFYISFPYGSSEAEHGFYMFREDGVWKLGGNQWLLDIDIDPVAIYDQGSDTVTDSGLSVWFDDEEGAAAEAGLDYIVVTGPGLPQSGLTSQQGGSLSDWYTLYQEGDGLDLAAIGMNAEYQVALYDDQSVLIDQYSVIVPEGPLSMNALDSNAGDYFCEITSPSLSELENFTGGSLNCSWMLPEGMHSDDVRLRWDTGSGWTESDLDLDANDTSATLDIVDNTYPDWIRLEMEVEDVSGREFVTVLDASNITYRIAPTAYIQYRSGQDDYYVYLPATENGQPISSDDIADVNLYNSADEEIAYSGQLFWPGHFFLYDCRPEAPEIYGPVQETGYVAYGIDPLSPDTYTAELVPYSGQSAQIEIAYPGRLDLPVVDSATMESGWDDAGSLELAWQNPASGWGDVDHLRVVMYDHQQMHLAFVVLDPSATSVTIPASLLSRFPELQNTRAASWQVQAIAMDANGMSYARGASEAMPVESAAGYSFGQHSYLQYRTHSDSSMDGSYGYFPIQKDGAQISPEDIAAITVRDAQGNEVAIADNGNAWSVWSASYNYMIASPFGEYGPFQGSGVFCRFAEALPEGTYQVEIQTNEGDTIYSWIQASTQLALPVIDNTTMASAWDADGNLVLSWENPAAGWEDVDQVRVVLYDRYGRELLYAVDAAGGAGLQQDFTIPVDTINNVTSLYPRGSYPALWRVQTDARDTDEMVYARGVSNIQVLSYFIDLLFLQQVTYEDDSSSWQAWMGMLSPNGIDPQDLSGFQVLDSNDNEVVPTHAEVWGSPVPYLFYDTTQEEPWLSGENWLMGYFAAFDFINHPASYRLSANLTEQGALVAQVSVPENVGMPVIPASSVNVSDQTDSLLVEWTSPDDASWSRVSEILVVFSAEIAGQEQDVLFVGVPADAESVEIPDSVEAAVLNALADAGYPDVSNVYLRQIRTVAYNEDGMQYARGVSNPIND